jgi:sulfide:quinone oxidoreductase
MKKRVLILGAGFAGLELATSLSEGHGDAIDVTVIDKSDAFIFGFAKLDVMFGKATVDRDFAKPGVTFKRETIKSIDPAAKTVVTDAGTHQADILVIALGADYDVTSTPGVVLGDNEFYSVPGAIHLATVLPTFTRGHAVIGVCGAPYKCPPAPSECALMLHDYLQTRGVRGDCHITMVNPLPTPVPPSPETSQALIAAFAERDITYLPSRRVVSVDRARKVVVLDDGSELPCDLFMGVPKNRAPDVVVAAGLTTDGWVTVDKFTLQTPFPGVYALGDLANTGAPKAGVFAEGAAKTVAANGANRIARVDVDFFSGPKATGKYHEPSEELRADKHAFGASRRARWFGQA